MTFKIAHCADWHIGYKSGRQTDDLGVNLRLLDGMRALEEVVESIIEEGVDCVVIAGDVFHTPFPTPYEIHFVQQQLWKFWEAGIAVYQLAGNHEATDVASDLASSKVLDDPWRKIYSHVEPYVKYEITDGVFLHMVSHHQYSRQEDTFSEIKPVDGAINLFTTHGSVMDPETSMVLSTPQSPREIVIPDFILEQWDYSLLGHIHERKYITDKMYYNGSLIRRGFSDKECELGRGWTLFEILPDGSFKLSQRTVEQRPQFDFTPIDASKFTAPEVTDIILDRLSDTQELATAPILRQKIINATPSLLAALDSQEISSKSAHAFSWQLQVVADKSDKSVELTEPAESQTLQEFYKSWSTASEEVKESTLGYIEKGLESWIGTEE